MGLAAWISMSMMGLVPDAPRGAASSSLPRGIGPQADSHAPRAARSSRAGPGPSPRPKAEAARRKAERSGGRNGKGTGGRLLLYANTDRAVRVEANTISFHFREWFDAEGRAGSGRKWVTCAWWAWWACEEVAARRGGAASLPTASPVIAMRQAGPVPARCHVQAGACG